MKRIFLIINIIFVFVATASAGDFKKVDEYAKRITKATNYKTMALKLTKPFASKKEKVRAIYVWIAHNIKYDYAKYKRQQKKGGYRIVGRNKRDIKRKKNLIRIKKINAVYKKGRGVCEDYSYLFQAMCTVAGIKTAYITGNIRLNPKRIGYFPKANKHAWNAVYVNNKWHLIDVTWAAGTVTNGRFSKRFTDDYFMTPPDIFILEHYPDNPKWQLLTKPVSKKQFASNVFLYSGFHDYGIKAFSPHKGFLNANKKYETVKITFKNRLHNVVMFERGKIIKLATTTNGKEIQLKIPTYHKYNKDIILGVKKGNSFVPILQYKIKSYGRH